MAIGQALALFSQFVQEAKRRASQLDDLVPDRNRGRVHHLARDQLLRSQLAQSRHDRLFRCASDHAGKVVEPDQPILEVPQDRTDPFAVMISDKAGKVVMDWGMASSENTQGSGVVTIGANRPNLATTGKTTDGRFVGENPRAALYRPQKQTGKGAIILPPRWTLEGRGIHHDQFKSCFRTLIYWIQLR